MCKGNQMPEVVRPYPGDEEPQKQLEGWDEVDHVIAAAAAILKGLNKKTDGHWAPRGGPG
jgi:hypothetical protein